jgi:putative ABC transport system permease protein
MLEMDTFWQDLRYGVRMLWKNPAFTIIAVISLALGIGANTTIFSVINAVMFQPLPYKDPDRLMIIWETEKKNRGSRRMPPTANMVDWKNQSQTFEDIGMVSPGSGPSNLTGLGPAERIREQMVSPNLFSVLGINPVLGRTFVTEDVRGEDSRPVLLSYEYWTRRFDRDPKVLGLSFYVEGSARTVIGVMPPEFSIAGARDVDLWQTLNPNHSRWAKRTDQWLIAVGRLRLGLSMEQAKAEMDAIAARLEHTYPASNKDVGVRVEPMSVAFGNRGAGSFLYPLFGAVGFVLLIACTNVANLLLARMTARQKEVAVRASLGAGRWRMVRQLLTESSLLALLSGALGAVLSIWGIDLVMALTPERGLRNVPVHIDIQVLAFAIGISVLTGLLFGLAPALSASKLDLAQALKTGAVPRLRRSSSRLLVVCEVALAMVLLVGAGLMISSLLRLHRVNPGFDPQNLLTMEIFLSGPRYMRNLPDNMKQVTPEATAFYRQVLDRIERLPGVESVGTVSQLPTRYLEDRTFTILGKAAPQSDQRPGTGYNGVSPAYFRTMRIPLKSGRYIEERDTESSPWVAVVSESFVRLYFPNENPIGQFIVTRTEPYRVEEPKPRQIVGVVGDVKWGLRSDAPPVVYASFRQQPDALPGGRATGHLRQNLVLRFTLGAKARQADAVTAIRKMVAEIDKDQPVYSVMPMSDLLSASVWAWQFYSQLLGAFAAAALILSALGIYGVMSYFVSQRTREIGIRMALGGDRAHVMRLVIWHGLSLTGVGLIVGALAAFALTGLIARLLYGVTRTDPLTFTIVAVLMAAVALVASYVPAWRAARVDPLIAVRQE